METQLVPTKKNASGWISRILLLIGIGGGAWLLFSSFKGKDEVLPDPGEYDPYAGWDENEEYLSQWCYSIFQTPGEAEKLVQLAINNQTTFQHEMWAKGIDLYSINGPLDVQSIIDKFNARTRYFEIIIKKSTEWFNLVKENATNAGVSIEIALRKAAQYSVVNELRVPYERLVSNALPGEQVSGIYPNGQHFLQSR